MKVVDPKRLVKLNTRAGSVLGVKLDCKVSIEQEYITVIASQHYLTLSIIYSIIDLPSVSLKSFLPICEGDH